MNDTQKYQYVFDQLTDIFHQKRDFLHFVNQLRIGKKIIEERKYNVLIDKEGKEKDIWTDFGEEPFKTYQDGQETVEFFILPDHDDMKDLPLRLPDVRIFPRIPKGTSYTVASVVLEGKRFGYSFTSRDQALQKLMELVERHAPTSDNYKSYDFEVESFTKKDLMERLKSIGNSSIEANLCANYVSFSIDFWNVVL